MLQYCLTACLAMLLTPLFSGIQRRKRLVLPRKKTGIDRFPSTALFSAATYGVSGVSCVHYHSFFSCIPIGGPCQYTVSGHETWQRHIQALSDHPAAWKILQNVPQWVLDTIEKGYRIQFACHPPSTGQVSFLQQELQFFLYKGAI